MLVLCIFQTRNFVNQVSVDSDGPMIDYNRKSVGLAFRLR